jgi:glycogen debranching enzyme
MLPKEHSRDGHGFEDHLIDPLVDIKDVILYPEEEITRVEAVALKGPQKALTAIEALCYLANVNKPEEIGNKDPVVAALAFPENHDKRSMRLYEVLFGRDSLTVAAFVLNQYPLLARTTLKKLAELQGIKLEPASEEEVGKIIHEYRGPTDPIAQELTVRRGWAWPYYGTIDATPRFISLLAAYTRLHDKNFLDESYRGKDGEEKTMFDAAFAAIKWLKEKISNNKEGLLESLRLNKVGGNAIQSWKDSVDSHHRKDGSLASLDQGIASIEVQGLGYDALLDAIEILKPHLEYQKEISELANLAVSLKACVLEKFWIEDKEGSYFALGSDRDKNGSLRLLDVKTSNMGHLLSSRILDDSSVQPKIESMVKTLLSSSMRTKFGIRTLAEGEKRYRPNSYHNGSICGIITSWIYKRSQKYLGKLIGYYKTNASIPRIYLWRKYGPGSIATSYYYCL